MTTGACASPPFTPELGRHPSRSKSWLSASSWRGGHDASRGGGAASLLFVGTVTDEWAEVRPSRRQQTGVAINYDAPQSEPPQCLLLCEPPVEPSTDWTPESAAEMVGHAIVNLHYPTEVHAMRIRVGVEYKNRPNRVKDALFRAASTANGVLAEPKVKVFLVDFADFAVIYEIKFYMGNHSRINEINDAVRTNIWYELKRQGITIPFPIRTLQLERRAARPVQEDYDEARTILRDEPLFECLSDAQIDNLVKEARLNYFGRGENVIKEGAEGDSMFVLLQGAARVWVSRNGTSIPIATLSAGDCFGEMSLLTGESRTATVQAESDCYVLEIGKPVMADVLRESPDCLERLSELLAKRKMENEGVLKEAASQAQNQKKEREYTASFLNRLRTFFEL